MSWQKCPVCNGSGWSSVVYNVECPTCNGQRIIDEITGKPPAKPEAQGESK